MKRTHGSNPKMSPHYIGPCVVVKRYGPVNWGIEDQESRKSKVVHNDLLQLAGKIQNATILPTQLGKLHVGPGSHTHNFPQIDRAAFTSNEFTTPSSAEGIPLQNEPFASTQQDPIKETIPETRVAREYSVRGRLINLNKFRFIAFDNVKFYGGIFVYKFMCSLFV